jgi:prepilin-type N-terminal cleavage/methylation domain-containing protein
MKNYNTKKGFTLIELLVVISIISLLTSIIFVSISSARNKAKDALIKDEVSKYVSLMNFTFDQTNSYCDLANNPNAWVVPVGCTSITSPTSPYYNDAIRLCNDIIKNSGIPPDPPYTPSSSYKFLIYYPVTCTTAFSITTYLNSGRWYCAGSSGRTSENATYAGGAGCYDNP